MTQAPHVIYAPVWVQEFAPVEQKTVWIGIIQIGAPVGIMLGYLLAGLLIAVGISWKVSIILQVVAIIWFISLFLGMGYEYIDNPWTSPLMEEWREKFLAQGLYHGEVPLGDSSFDMLMLKNEVMA